MPWGSAKIHETTKLIDTSGIEPEYRGPLQTLIRLSHSAMIGRHNSITHPNLAVAHVQKYSLERPTNNTPGFECDYQSNIYCTMYCVGCGVSAGYAGECRWHRMCTENSTHTLSWLGIPVRITYSIALRQVAGSTPAPAITLLLIIFWNLALE